MEIKELGVSVLTEKNKLKPAVASGIKTQVIAKLGEFGFEKKENGRLALVVATADGHTITANIDLTIGMDTQFEKKETETKAKTTASVSVPSLFD